MRGKPQAQPEFLTIINLNQRVRPDHPLRGIKERVDKVLVELSPLFDALYADEGRPSIPPEQLLKSRILMALYSVRRERLFCEELAYNLLWLWILDRELDEGSFDATDEADAVQAADFIGKKRMVKRSWGFSAGKRNVNYSETEKHKIKPHKLRNLRDHECVLVHCERGFRRVTLSPLEANGTVAKWFWALLPKESVTEVKRGYGADLIF